MGLPWIPTPQRCVCFSCSAYISSRTPVILQMPVYDSRLERASRQLFSNVTIGTGAFALFTEGNSEPVYDLQRPEGYILSIRYDIVTIASQDAAGLFYGLQTLGQWFCMKERPSLEICDWPDLALRSDYLDLRGLFPKFDNIVEYIKELAQYKINTLVVEYEDKLPRRKKELCHPTQCWSEEQHRLFLKTASDYFIDVIPLQQTFGHLEYVLKLPEYRYLRETPDAPGEMCPLRTGAAELAEKLLEETALLHPESKYLHLGCDEVWSLGRSAECRASGQSRGKIAADYINRLAGKAVSLGKIPIVWHDMLAEGSDEDLAGLNRNLIVAVWLYSPEAVNTQAIPLMERFHALGMRTLPCCSVRASDMKADQNYPQIEQRLRNVDAWAEMIQNSRCSGMVNTNWCSTFSLGNPYGLFETSRYPAFYAAERCWNLKAETADFLERFLAVFHGVPDPVLNGGKERRYDYYKAVAEFLPFMTRNRDTAELIDIMRRFEYAAPVNYTVFRGRLFPHSEVELACLRERALKDYRNLGRVRQELKKILSKLLESEMADLFLESRDYPNRLFQRELENILGISLDISTDVSVDVSIDSV